MRTLLSGCCVATLAIALSACDAATGPVGLITTAPSVIAAVNASISFVSVGQAPAFGISGCTGSQSAGFDVVIVASVPMQLNHVTIQLIDGSNLGGPMVTFPQASLSTQFGTTNVVAGVARTFTFWPQFSCVAVRPARVAAQLRLVDATGAPRGVTIAGPLP
jgi:hypothetical protein